MVLWQIIKGVKSVFQAVAPQVKTWSTKTAQKAAGAKIGTAGMPMGDMVKIQNQELYEMNREKSFAVHVQYCGGWGYGKRYNFAHEHIMKVYPNATVTGEAEAGRTENFLVKINDEYVIYDKKANKNEPMDEKTMEKIIDNMNKILKVY